MVNIFAGSGSATGVPGCALVAFSADLPLGLGVQPLAGVLGLRVRFFAGEALGFVGVLLAGIFEAPMFSVDVWAVLGVWFDLVFMAHLSC